MEALNDDAINVVEEEVRMVKRLILTLQKKKML